MEKRTRRKENGGKKERKEIWNRGDRKDGRKELKNDEMKREGRKNEVEKNKYGKGGR